jgi:hypothetical protein
MLLLVGMVTYLLYTKGSPEQRDVEHLATELAGLQVDTKLVEADSAEGVALNEVYDVPQRPSVVLTTDDGTLINRWLGQIPPADEVSYYAHQ